MPSLKKNLIINISYQLFVVLVPLIVAPYVTRTIGPEGVGVYSYTFSIASCFALFGMLGVANYGNRSVAAIGNDIQNRSRIFWNVWTIQLLCTTFVVIVYMCYCLLFPIHNRVLAIIQVVTVLCSAFDISWFFFGIEKFQVTVIRNLVIKILNLVCIFAFVKSEKDLTLYVIIMVLGALLNNLLLFLFLKKEILFVKPSRCEIKSHIKPIIILFFPVIAISIYKLMDKVMIGILSNTSETGYYEYAEKIIGLPGTVITAIGAVMLPRLSSVIGQNDRKKASFLLQVTMEFMMFLTIGMSAGIFSIGQDFAPLFFGKKFSKSGLIMMALAPSVIFQGWANVIRTEYLIPEKKDTIYVKSAWIGAIVNLTINAILIPHFEAVGAAIGTVFAEVSVAVYQSVCASKEIPITKYIKRIVFYFLPAIGMWLAIMSLRYMLDINDLISLFGEVVFGMLVYLCFSVPYLYKCYKELRGSTN